MRKIMSILSAIALIFALSACSQTGQEGMYIKPSEFSEETRDILELFDDEVRFFDISFDESVKSQSISLWVFRDGQWHEDGKTFGKVEFSSERIAIRLTENSYDLYIIDETGHVKYSYQVLETTFKDSTATSNSRIDKETPLELNSEIPVWVKTGTDKSSMEVTNITEDFRNSDCNAGIAITLTVSDKTAE